MKAWADREEVDGRDYLLVGVSIPLDILLAPIVYPWALVTLLRRLSQPVRPGLGHAPHIDHDRWPGHCEIAGHEFSTVSKGYSVDGAGTLYCLRCQHWIGPDGIDRTMGFVDRHG